MMISKALTYLGMKMPNDFDVNQKRSSKIQLFYAHFCLLVGYVIHFFRQ